MPYIQMFLTEERDEKVDKLKTLLRLKTKNEAIIHIIDKAKLPETNNIVLEEYEVTAPKKEDKTL